MYRSLTKTSFGRAAAGTRRFFSIALALPIVLGCIAGTAGAQTWELVWSDEFDYQGLPDNTKWGYDVGGHGWGNNEAQYYTQNRQENARADGASLIIEAHKEDYAGKSYTSARLVSRNRGDWTYGRVRVRAMLPSGRGTWPAIWMLPTSGQYGNGSWPDNGEIDIMEHVGYDPGRIHGSVHMNKYNHLNNNAKGASVIVSDAETAFHDYSIDWTPTRIDFAIDDSVYFTYRNEDDGWTSWPFDQPFHLLLNIAIGGSWGGAQGIDDSIFPQKLVVDYVRVYRYLAQPEVTLSAPAQLTPGDTLNLMAGASDADGTVQQVEIRQGDGILGQFSAPPYSALVADVHEGCYSLNARAIDDMGWTTISDTVALVVGTGCGQAPYLVSPHPVPGRIEAEYYDLGGPNVGYFDLNPANQGDGIRQSEGVDVYRTGDGPGDEVRAARHEWLAYTVNVDRSGYYTFFVRLFSQNGRAAFTLAVDGQDTVTYDELVTANTWSFVFQQDVVLSEGLRDLRLTIDAYGTSVNWIRFTFTRALSADSPDRHNLAMLHGNHPNPFDRQTGIRYSIARPGPAKLEIYNVLGQHIATLADRYHATGQYHVQFDGAGLGAGLYVYRLTTGTVQRQRTMLLLR